MQSGTDQAETRAASAAEAPSGAVRAGDGAAEGSGGAALSEEEKAERAAAARQKAAIFGDLTMLAMQHPSYRNMAIADLDWLIGPAVLTGNYLILNATRPDGIVVPVAALLWARVSEEVDRRLEENLHRPFRLSPQEWVSGEIVWIAQTLGPPQAVEGLIKEARENHDAFKSKQLKQRVRADDGRAMVSVVG